MRRNAVVLAVPVAIGALLVEAATTWRRHPRFGTAFVNSVVNPAKDLPGPLRRVMTALGFKYLNLRTLAAHPA